MIFKFKNIGVVESAEIEVEGLTVLTGLNDTGKSFLSKAIYSVIKTIKESEEQSAVKKGEFISGLLNQLFSTHRQYVVFNQAKTLQFSPNVVNDKVINSLIKGDSETEISAIILDYKSRIIADFELNAATSPNLKTALPTLIARIEEISNKAISYCKEDSNIEKKYKEYFDQIIIRRLFQEQFNTIGATEPAEINVKSGVTELCNIQVNAAGTTTTFSYENKNPILINDVSVIETPTIVQLSKFITNTLAFPGSMRKLYQHRIDLPFHYYDLVGKIENIGAVAPVYNEIIDTITHIIGGQLVFKLDERAIVFIKENGASIKAFNIATGIKSFGLIQLLLSSNAINPSSILVIDEPEVHLHPQWEIQYARLIVLLSKIGPVVISTHSIYFLSALQKAVKEYNAPVKYYFGERPNGKSTTTFNPVDGELEPVYKALARPMAETIR